MAPVRIHTKFLVLVIGIFIVIFAVLSFVIVRRDARLLARKNAEQEQLVARTVAADLADSMLTGRPRGTLTLLDSLQGSHGLVRLEVLRRDGTPAFKNQAPRISLPQVEQSFREGRQIDLYERGPTPLHTNLIPLLNEPACRRCHRRGGEVLGVILTSHSLQDTIAEVRASKQQLILLLAGAVPVIGIALFLAIRKAVLAPLRTLHNGADVIGRGDLGHRISIDSNDEFQDLASAFNEMAGRLKGTYAGLENTVRIRTAELNESVRLLRGILSSMSSGVVLLSRDGTVKLINRQGAWILGRGREDLLGTKLAEIVPETAVFQSVRVGTYEEMNVAGPDGTAVPVGFTSSYYAGTEGEQEGLLVVFQDLTELKELQGELLNKERFAAMGRVVAGVAHEIRNPLFGISAIGQIFERDLKDPAHQDLSRALLGETRRLNHLVEELLIYGRPMKLRLEEVDLRVLWEEVLDLHREELRKKRLTVTGDYAVRHPEAYCDVHQIRQVFLNLLRNAIEATPEGGAISITMLIEDRFIVFRIADTGAGIPNGQLDNVFDLFYTTKPKGTGLGLAICRKIVQDHGGDISIESEQGQGTAVTLKLSYQRMQLPESGGI